MRITLITIGSRGDVQPYLALGLGFKEAGYVVTLVTHSTYESLIRERGIDFSPVEGDIRKLVESGEAQNIFDTGRNSLLFSRRFIAAGEPMVEQMVRDMHAACQGADYVILGGLGYYGGYEVALDLNLPFVQAALQPILPTRSVQSVFFPPAPAWLPFKRAYNLLTHTLFTQIFWYFVRGPVNNMRKKIFNQAPAPFLGPYRALNEKRIPLLLGYSPTLLPKPEDWNDWVHVTGYWFLDPPSNWRPPQEMEDFLAAGPTPVYIGFGSMSNRDPEETTGIILDALAAADVRGVLLTGWAGLQKSDLPETVIKVDNIPHSWLFPKMAAVIHHGGAGTAAAGLRAGVPSISIPFFGDQFFWGQRIADLGAGPQPLPRKNLTSRTLAKAIKGVIQNQPMCERAAAVGRQIRTENGVSLAVELFDRYVERIGNQKRCLSKS